MPSAPVTALPAVSPSGTATPVALVQTIVSTTGGFRFQVPSDWVVQPTLPSNAPSLDLQVAEAPSAEGGLAEVLVSAQRDARSVNEVLQGYLSGFGAAAHHPDSPPQPISIKGADAAIVSRDTYVAASGIPFMEVYVVAKHGGIVYGLQALFPTVWYNANSATVEAIVQSLEITTSSLPPSPAPSPLPTPSPVPAATQRIPGVIGPSQVFKLPVGIIQLNQACPAVATQTVPAKSSACVEQFMQQKGASPEAVVFFGQTGRILLDYRSYGPVDVGSVTHDIWCCYADTSDTEPVLLNGSPLLVLPLDEAAAVALSSYLGFAAAQATVPYLPALGAVPKLTMLGIDGITLDQVVMSPQQGQRFIFDLRLMAGCRACDSGYVAQLAFDFDPVGTYVGAVPLSVICLPLPGSRATCTPTTR